MARVETNICYSVASTWQAHPRILGDFTRRTARSGEAASARCHFFESERSPMPRYHFHLIDSQTVADKGGHELPDNATAERVAKQLGERLRGDLPQLRNRNFAIVVTDEEGERVCRIPIDPSN
jgi:hypothetical protein